MVAEAAREIPAGTIVGDRWRVEAKLGGGGMSLLYAVRHTRTTKRAALKVMLLEYAESKAMQARFSQEMTVTASLESDHIVKVMDGGADSALGVLFIVMELLQGVDLRAELLRCGGRLRPADVAIYLHQASVGLDLAHADGIVHRDLKPENLFLVRRDDGSPCVKVLDFGVAKYIAESLGSAKTTQAIGTPIYMSPEQIRGDGTIGYAADVYSLAHVAYDLLVGEPYWENERRKSSSLYGMLMMMAKGPSEPPSARSIARGVILPEAFDLWFARATAFDPLSRHASILEAASELLDLFPEALSASTRRIPQG